MTSDNHKHYSGEARLLSLIQDQLLQYSHALVFNTREGCLADAGLMCAGHTALPLQFKTTQCKDTAARTFKFHKTNRYSGCTVVCCAFVHDQIRCWVIPGHDLRKVRGLTITEGGRWDRPYAVDVSRLGSWRRPIFQQLTAMTKYSSGPKPQSSSWR